jgi:hypothetical protein
MQTFGGLAQLARAVGSQSTGRGFESHILQKWFTGLPDGWGYIVLLL